MSVPIIVVGALGRMGQAVIDLALNSPSFTVIAGVTRPSSSTTTTGPFPIYEHLESALSAKKSGVIIDFSLAELTPHHLACAQRFNCGIVIATTGHREPDLSLLPETAKNIPVLLAPNTSLMAHLCMVFSRLAAASLPHVDAGVFDMHHAHKKDAPSGTAKALIKAIEDGLLAQNSSTNVSVSSLRIGNACGEHTAYFFNDFERLEITHRVTNRRVFAEGALLAAQFLFDSAPGLYGMNDVLKLNMNIEK